MPGGENPFRKSESASSVAPLRVPEKPGALSPFPTADAAAAVALGAGPAAPKSALARQGSMSKLRGPREFSPKIGATPRAKKAVTFDRTDEVIQYDTVTPEPDLSNAEQFSWFEEPSDSPVWEAGVNDTLFSGRPLPQVPQSSSAPSLMNAPDRTDIPGSWQNSQGSSRSPRRSPQRKSRQFTSSQELAEPSKPAEQVELTNPGRAPIAPTHLAVQSDPQIVTPQMQPQTFLEAVQNNRMGLEERVDAVMDNTASPFVPRHRNQGSWRGSWGGHQDSLGNHSPANSDVSDFSAVSEANNAKGIANEPNPTLSTAMFNTLPAPSRKESLLDSQKRPQTQHISRRPLPTPVSQTAEVERSYSTRRRQILSMLDASHPQVPASITEEASEDEGLAMPSKAELHQAAADQVALRSGQALPSAPSFLELSQESSQGDVGRLGEGPPAGEWQPIELEPDIHGSPGALVVSPGYDEIENGALEEYEDEDAYVTPNQSPVRSAVRNSAHLTDIEPDALALSTPPSLAVPQGADEVFEFESPAAVQLSHIVSSPRPTSTSDVLSVQAASTLVDHREIRSSTPEHLIEQTVNYTGGPTQIPGRFVDSEVSTVKDESSVYVPNADVRAVNEAVAIKEPSQELDNHLGPALVAMPGPEASAEDIAMKNADQRTIPTELRLPTGPVAATSTVISNTLPPFQDAAVDFKQARESDVPHQSDTEAADSQLRPAMTPDSFESSEQSLNDDLPLEDEECKTLPPLRRDPSKVGLSSLAGNDAVPRHFEDFLVIPDTIPNLQDPISPVKSVFEENNAIAVANHDSSDVARTSSPQASALAAPSSPHAQLLSSPQAGDRGFSSPHGVRSLRSVESFAIGDAKIAQVERVPLGASGTSGGSRLGTPRLDFIAPSPMAWSLPGNPAMSTPVTVHVDAEPKLVQSPPVGATETTTKPQEQLELSSKQPQVEAFDGPRAMELDSDLSDSSDIIGESVKPADAQALHDVEPIRPRVAATRPVSSFAILDSEGPVPSDARELHLQSPEKASEDDLCAFGDDGISTQLREPSPATGSIAHSASILSQTSQLSVPLEMGESLSSVNAELDRVMSQPRGGYTIRDSGSVIKASSPVRNITRESSAAMARKSNSTRSFQLPSGVSSTSIHSALATRSTDPTLKSGSGSIIGMPKGSSVTSSRARIFPEAGPREALFEEEETSTETPASFPSLSGLDRAISSHPEIAPAQAKTATLEQPAAPLAKAGQDPSKSPVVQVELPARGIRQSVIFYDGAVKQPDGSVVTESTTSLVSPASAYAGAGAGAATSAQKDEPSSGPRPYSGGSALEAKFNDELASDDKSRKRMSAAMLRYQERRRSSHRGALPLEKGRLFVRIEEVKQVGLPNVENKNASMSVTIDNGVHCITTPDQPLKAVTKVGEEFEIVAKEDTSLVFTLRADWKRKRPSSTLAESKTTSPAGAPGSPKDDKAKRRWSMFRRQKAKTPKTPELPAPATEEWHDLVANDGSFGRAVIWFSDIQKIAFGKPHTVEIAARNEWAKKEAYAGASTLVVLTFMFVPRMSRSEVLPATMEQALEQIRVARQSVKIELTGYMTQAGGDCIHPRRRYFILDDDMLIAHSDSTHRPRVTINLRKAVRLVPAPHNNTDFSVLFTNGEELQFRVESGASRSEWLESLENTMRRVRTRSPWLSLVLYGADSGLVASTVPTNNKSINRRSIPLAMSGRV